MGTKLTGTHYFVKDESPHLLSSNRNIKLCFFCGAVVEYRDEQEFKDLVSIIGDCTGSRRNIKPQSTIRTGQLPVSHMKGEAMYDTYPQPKPEKREGLPYWMAGIYALILAVVCFGGGILAGGAQTQNVVASPQPTVTQTVTKTAEPKPAATKTVETVKEVTPKICIEALDLSAEIVGFAGEGFNAIAVGDFDRVNEITDEINARQGEVKRTFDGCREKR